MILEGVVLLFLRKKNKIDAAFFPRKKKYNKKKKISGKNAASAGRTSRGASQDSTNDSERYDSDRGASEGLECLPSS